MFDVTFLIPEYPEWDDPTLPDPFDVIPDEELERLDLELYYLIDSGAFDEF